MVAYAIWRYVERPARRVVVAKLGPMLAAALATGSARLGPARQRQRG